MTRATTRREFVELGAAGAAGLAIGSLVGPARPADAADQAVATVFSPIQVGSLKLANRLVRASTAEGASPDGLMSDDGLAIYRDLAAGGVGLILSGHMVAVPGGDAHARQTYIFDDQQIPALRRITDAVHQTAPGCPVIAEISHAGQAGVIDPVAPSEVPARTGRRVARVLSSAEVEELVGRFASAVLRAREAGFDGVEIHGAHGYLLASFLSPALNRRDDAWGGSPERRAAVIRSIAEQARRLVGPSFPILIKLNGDDQGAGEQAAEGFAVIAREVERAGVDAIEVSGRMPCRPDVDEPAEEAYFREYTELLDVRVPVILTGGHRSLGRIAALLADPQISLAGISRPLIREPALPNRWRSGEGSDGAACISCNRCLAILGQEPTHCIHERLLREGKIA